MARIAGVNLPNNKRLEVGLTYIYGIGPSTARQTIAALGMSPDEKIRDLTDDEVTALRNYIDSNLQVEGDLRRERSQAIKRLSEIGAYRGIRHRRGSRSTASGRRRTRARGRARRRPSGAGRRRRRSKWRLLADRPPAGGTRRRVRKNIAIGQAHIKTSFNNTIVTLTDTRAT